MTDPMDNHKCHKIAQMINCGDGREMWIGVLLEPISGYETETHCLHIVTPAKTVVFGVYPGDAGHLAVFAQILHDGPINQRWLDTMEKVYRHKAESEASNE